MSEQLPLSEAASAADMLREREMELTAALLRVAVDQHPKLQPLPDGRRFLLGYDSGGVWLSLEGSIAARFNQEEWWKARLDTREDRSCEIAAELARVVLSPRELNPGRA